MFLKSFPVEVQVKNCLIVGFIVLCIAVMFTMLIIYQFQPQTIFQINQLLILPKVLNISTLNMTRAQQRHVKKSLIPTIIHQIWNDEAIPEVFTKNIRGLVAHNKPPIWKYYFWTIETGTRLIRKEFPNLLLRYIKADQLLKADILRLVVLYHFGGVYFDLDTVSVKPLDPFIESNNCSFVTDPVENVFEINRPKPILLITNSALFCEPGNWFFAELIKTLSNQSPSCKNAIECTGPKLISRHYKFHNVNNKSKYLPPIIDYRYFEDKPGPFKAKVVNRACVREPFINVKYEWAKEICRQWLKRGGMKRNITEIAYTYHTWYHTNLNSQEIKNGTKTNISELVPHSMFFK